MGGGLGKEHMLIVHWAPEPTDTVNKIRTRFPHLRITYHHLPRTSSSSPTKQPPSVPTNLWHDITILVTFFTFPPSPSAVPNLKWVHLFSAGADHVLNTPVLHDTDVAITTSSGIHGPPITEWIVMTTLAAKRHYGITHEAQKHHHWASNDPHFRSVSDFVGARIGIAGYGSIGRQAARVYHAMGATVLAYTASPRDTAAQRADQGYVVPHTGDPEGTIPSAWYSGTSTASLHDFLAQDLDMLIVSLPLTPATTHLFGKPEFDILSRQHAFVVNISRGKILDQPALVEALNDGRLRGAAVDVTDPEPLPADDPLWDAKNAVVTPHISGVGTEYMGRAFDVLMTNLERREQGKRMFNLVDRKRGY